MRNSTMISSLSLLLSSLIGWLTSSAIGAEIPRPNIVLIMADDLGYGDISPYGGWIKTPALEQMAAEGMRFTDYHSSGNVCSPTRAGLLTGRYQQRAGITGVVVADATKVAHHYGLKEIEVTLPELLKKQGYTTAIFGKWHLGYTREYNPTKHGFDTFRGYVSGNIDFISHYDQEGVFDWWQETEQKDEPGYTTHLIDRHAVDFIKQHRDEPFFLYLPHEAPHYPFQSPDDPAYRSEGQGNRADAKHSPQEVKDRYRRMVEEMDRSVGNVLAALEENGLSERTMVVFVSDNGAAGKWGDNSPLRGAKGSDWEGGHRVPGIVRWKGKIAPGRVSEQLCISLDWMPTMLVAAGVKLPTDRPLDGVDLLPILQEQQEPYERQLFWNGNAVREGAWKLMIENRAKQRVSLFQLGDDLAESTDLADKYPERVRAMLEANDRWKKDVATGATAQP